ncbi:MAG: NAD(P)/FAD-dependent oxidoreductase [Oscillospiraceae bacterium]|nr:NAD(P)/FAD-dependent oxidoreductase [Oscillospiraceae bacterium]
MQEVAIIGAGPAGITAGLELLRQGENQYHVTIYEESAVAGGISRTVNHKNNRMDIGGHRFFSKNQQVMNWWNDLMPFQGQPSFDDIQLGRRKKLVPGGADPEQTDKVMLVRNRVSRIYYQKKFFDYPVSLKWDTLRNMGLVTTMQAGMSYLQASVMKKQEDSLEDFYINRFGKKLYAMFFEGYTEKLWGRHPSEISADWGAQRVKGLSVSAVLEDMFRKITGMQDPSKKETSLIEEFYYPKYGPGQLWETALEEFQKLGGNVVFHASVKQITTNERNLVKSMTYQNTETKELQEIPCDILISSMPVKDLVAGMNDVPQRESEIAAGLPYRDFVTIGLLVDRLELKNKTNIPTLGNIVPDCWIYVQDTGVKLGRIQIFNNWSPYMVQNPSQQVWIGLEYFCQEGDRFWNLNSQQSAVFAVKELRKMDILSKGAKVFAYHKEKVKKAYPAYFDTYESMDELIQYLNQFENLYCVGRNGQHRYNNMDHSMMTSFETVKNILTGRKDKSNIWNVNTEQSYHEINSGESENPEESPEI